MEKTIYLTNPCKASSLPYWKSNLIKIPENMKVVLEEDLQSDEEQEYSDERFFKLIHRLKNIEKPTLDNRYCMLRCGVSEYAKHIATCYSDVGISPEELMDYQTHTVYDRDLWIAVTERGCDEIIASGIAELDTDIKEGILEWIQVLPEYRGKGLGKFIVNELLWRMKDQAEFVTVSGKVDNETHPRELYIACGFFGEEIWHVMKK